MTAADLVPPDHVIVVFGANGDLARRKLLPALYHLHAEGLLPARWRMVCNARSTLSDSEFLDFTRGSLDTFARCPVTDDAWGSFAERLTYVSGAMAPGDHQAVAAAVRQAEEAIGGDPRRLFYLAVPPPAFGPITEALGVAALTSNARVVYEKPFGLDRDSFAVLDETVHAVLDEPQIYRIDHFLAKETLQNVLALRFANGMFEPVWNRQHIDHVQIDVPEELGVGTRAGFYERTGALRDMVVTHLFQVLSVIALEPPTSLAPDPLLNEKAKVFEAMLPLACADVVRGQYDGYRSAAGVDPNSDTETFVAARVAVDNWRWADVPFYLRTGKRMAASRQTVTLAFREPPRQMFADLARNRLPNDHLTLDLASQGEAVVISFMAKRPGPAIRLGRARMTFTYDGSFGSSAIGPYERLMHDALIGDRTLFTRADGIARTWELVADVLAAPPPLQPYPPGSWGPPAAEALLDHRGWYLPEDAAVH